MATADLVPGQATVLIVEDHAPMRAMLRAFLQAAFPACGILEAESGARALEICTARRPQLVLMDICLPDANGIELTERLKVSMSETRVIVISYLSGATLCRCRARCGRVRLRAQGPSADRPHPSGDQRPAHGARRRMALAMASSSARQPARPGASRNLRERADQLALAQEAIGLTTWIWDVKEDRMQWYGDMGALLGHPPRKFTGDFQIYLDALHPDDRRAARRTFIECLKGKRPQYRTEERVIWPDGSVHWLETYGRGSYRADGRCVQMAGVVSDITERKKSDEDLRRFRAAMDISGDAILLIDRASMRYVDVNRTLCELVGYTRGEMLGMTPMDLFSADRRTLERDYDAIIADNNSSASKVEGHYRHRNGTMIPIETRRRALRAGDGWIIVGTARDITERKNQEARLAASEARFSAAFRSAPNALSITRRSDGTFVEVNEGYERSSGWSAAEVTGRSAADLGIWVDPAERDAYLAGLTRDGSIRDQRVQLRARDGKVRICQISAANITIDGETFTIAQTRDLTPVVQALRAQQASEAELRESEARFRNLTELSSDWYWEQDEELRLAFHSNGFAHSSGTTSSKLLGKLRWEDPDRTPLSCTWDEHRATLESRKPFRDFEYFRTGDDGKPHFVSLSGMPVYDDAGTFKGYRGIGRNITQRKQDEQRLARHAQRQEGIARFGQFALGKHNPEQLFEEAVRTVHAHGADAAALYELVPATDELVVRAAEGDGTVSSIGGSAPLPQDSPLRRIAAEGTPFLAGRAYLAGRSANTPWGPWVRRMGNAAYAPVRGEGGPFGVLAIYAGRENAFGDEDLRFVEAIGNVLSAALQRHQAERRLAYLAQFDALTGLPNRNLVQDRLAQTIAHARREQRHAAVLYIDLDRFKLVNDSFGHDTGDRLITLVGERLARCTRRGDTLGRISGDEFAVVLADLAHPDDAAIVAQKILDTLARPLDLDGNEIYITGSIGISIFPQRQRGRRDAAQERRHGDVPGEEIDAQRIPVFHLQDEPALDGADAAQHRFAARRRAQRIPAVLPAESRRCRAAR